MTFIDIVIVIVLVANIYLGYKKGLIRTFISIGSYILAVIFSKLFYLPFSTWLQNYTSISERVKGFIDNNFDGIISLWVSNEASKDNSFMLWEYLKNYAYDEAGVINNYTSNMMDTLKNQAIENIATLFINLVSIIVIFLVVRFAVLFLGNILDRVAQFPLLKPVNNIGGLAIGTFRGFLIILITVLILMPFAIKSPSGLIATGLNDSFIIERVFNNWLLAFLEWIL